MTSGIVVLYPIFTKTGIPFWLKSIKVVDLQYEANGARVKYNRL